MAAQIAPGGSGRSFLDSNILIYTDDPRDPARQQKAFQLLQQHLRERTGVISVQVLQEYFSVSTGKLRLPAELAKQRIENFALLHVVEPRVDDLLTAIDLHRLHRLSIWDALILRSAKVAGCSILLTEDLQHGQTIDGVRIVNPFLP